MKIQKWVWYGIIEYMKKEIIKNETVIAKKAKAKKVIGRVNEKVGKVKKEVKAKTEKYPACGLCGKRDKTCQKTDCCGNIICGDESKYVMFSYSHDICSRNHRKYTICASHYMEEHKGDWKDCKKCLNNFDTDNYTWFSTNEFNFKE